MIADARVVKRAGSRDVVVVGAGIAGISAAVAAARTGAKVLLLEKSILPGGLATAGLINWYEPLCDGAGRKMISGIAEELIQLSVKYSFHTLPDNWKDGKEQLNARGRYASYFSPAAFVLALDEYLKKNGVEVLFDVLATYPVMEHHFCKGIVTESKEGKLFFEAKAVVDASGDADMLYWAQVPTWEGQNYLSCIAHYVNWDGIEEARDKKNFMPVRRWMAVGANLNGKGHPEGSPLYRGLSAKEVTDFVMEGRKMIFEKARTIAGNSLEITSLPTQAQLRTTRHIIGEYTLTGCDEGRYFPDAVGQCGDFRTSGKHYEIPYRILWNKDFANIFAAGRIVSAEKDGWEVTRVIPVCALTGQAAGTAAALIIQNKCRTSELSITLLQETLRRQGVLIPRQ